MEDFFYVDNFFYYKVKVGLVTQMLLNRTILRRNQQQLQMEPIPISLSVRLMMIGILLKTTAEQVVRYFCTIIDEEGDIDLQLYDPLGNEIESSSANDNEHIDSFQLPDDGLYWFRIKYYRSGTSDNPPYQNTYALSFSLTDEPYCKQDQWEINDSAEQAVELPLGNNTLQNLSL